MNCRKVAAQDKGSTVAILALAMVFASSQTGAQAAFAKRPSFMMPTYNKLVEGAGPETNDVSARAEKPATTGGASSSDLLAPVTLDAGAQQATTAGAEPAKSDGGAPLLKSTVTINGFAPKGPVDPASKSLFTAPSGIADRLGENLKKAKQVNVMPLPLLVSPDEEEKKLETIADAEKTELADLWESTLARSPDIQFVVQKLMPSSSPGHASTIMMRMLSSAVFGAMGAVNMISPNPGMYAANNMGASMIMNVLQMQENKTAAKAKLSQTEAIMLYNMVRGTADRLVENFRNYKKTVTTLNRATTDLQDMQGMVAEARAGQDTSKQLEMEYTLRKQQRDVDAIQEDLRRYRQSMVDLAGPDAVAKLDKQIEEEQNKIMQATPAGTPNPNPSQSTGDAPAGQQTASTGNQG